jgi:hypothetical protein
MTDQPGTIIVSPKGYSEDLMAIGNASVDDVNHLRFIFMMRFFRSLSEYMSKHYGYTIDENKAYKTITNDIQIYASANSNGIIFGFSNVKRDRDILVSIFTNKIFKHYKQLMSDIIIDDENNAIYRIYKVRDIFNMDKVESLSISIFLFNCLSSLEIEYNKHIKE